MEDAFDYVIVGGGSAGSVLAARLSEDPSVTVCLLEAGKPTNSLAVRIPMGAVTIVPNYLKAHNWAFETEPQLALNNRTGFQPRGRGLGGSSAINAMIYIRGQRQDYDGWAASGCDGWSYDDVLPFFLKSEHNMRGQGPDHAAGGPLQVSEPNGTRPINDDFLAAAAACQYRLNQDFNAGDQEGVGYYQTTQFWDGPRKGERCSAAAAFLDPARTRPNLSIRTEAEATGLIFDGRRATGVSYRQNGSIHSVRARREVVVCGGAFQSPKLLLLSGIGPGYELADLGIQPLVEAPEVGKNLQDHLDFTLLYKSTTRDVIGVGLAASWQLLKAALEWRKSGTGNLRSNYAESGAFLKTSPDEERPDIQLHFVPALVDNHGRRLHLGYGFSCHTCVLRPKSRGSVTLAGGDPFLSPRIDPQFLTHPDDVQRLLKGVRITRQIMQTEPLARNIARELYTAEAQSDEQLLAHIRDRADTIYHPVGTCRMGSDPGSVVDSQLRVRGVEGLRVADASIMPSLISGNTNAPTIMIAEKAASLIAARA